MMLDLKENADYFFDAEAADRPVRFIERYLKHFTGKFAGQPFLLEPIQKQIVRDLFGWKSRRMGFRRFTDVYWEGAVGAGKSPLLAALGLYGLIADKEAGAQVYSFASTHPQARIVFDTAKKFIGSSRDLEGRLQVRHAEIRHPASLSFWRIVPGTGPGAGANPSMVMGDEAHDWDSSDAYDQLHERRTKREQPLMIVATNAGTSQATICWRLREKAVAALAGHGDPALYPIIWAAPESAKTDDPAAWRAANPLLGITIAEDKVRALCVEAMKDEAEERNFRRLYLSHWPKKKAEAWLDLQQWDDATPGSFVPPAAELVFVGVDLSQSDDLSAVVWVRVVADGKIYVDSHFWMPKATAEKYDRRDSIGYQEWAKDNHVTLLNSPTIDRAAMIGIADAVVRRCGAKKPTAVCYDPHRADVCVKTLEAAGVPCVAIQQGTSISPGTYELDRRLKEQSIVIAANPVLRFCAENATVRRDQRGNMYPVKPGATDAYEGRRGAKIDGIAALVTALTLASKHAVPAKKPNPRAILV